MWHAWERREKCTGFCGKARRIETFGRLRHRWEYGIRMDLGEIACGRGCRADSVGSGLGPAAGSCECDDEPSGSGSTEIVYFHLSVCPR
jgi:hypothetical protein